MTELKRYPRPIVRRPKPVVRYSYPIRPKNRTECYGGIRPCPFVSCRYNMYLDVMQKRIKFYAYDLEDLPCTCALDLADKHGGMALEEIAVYMKLSRERVRQIIDSSLRKIMMTDVDTI